MPEDWDIFYPSFFVHDRGFYVVKVIVSITRVIFENGENKSVHDFIEEIEPNCQKQSIANAPAVSYTNAKNDFSKMPFAFWEMQQSKKQKA